MSRIKFKEVNPSFEEGEPGEDDVYFSIAYDDEMKNINLLLRVGSPITPQEYFEMLASLLDKVSENPDSLFVESPHEDDPSLH